MPKANLHLLYFTNATSFASPQHPLMDTTLQTIQCCMLVLLTEPISVFCAPDLFSKIQSFEVFSTVHLEWTRQGSEGFV